MENSSINLAALIGKLWAHKFAFLLAWILTAVISYAATFLMTPKWESTTEFVPEYNLREMKYFQDLVEDYELDTKVGPQGDAIHPTIYAALIDGSNYMWELGQMKVTDINGTERSVFEFYQHKSDKRLNDAYDRMHDDITCKRTRRNEAVKISARATDPLVAQQIATLARELLADYIQRYRDERNERNLAHYRSLAGSNPMSQALAQIAEVEASQHQPVFVVLQQAAKPERSVYPHRLRISAFMVFLVTLLLTCWYWRRDIPEWL